MNKFEHGRGGPGLELLRRRGGPPKPGTGFPSVQVDHTCGVPICLGSEAWAGSGGD